MVMKKFLFSLFAMLAIGGMAFGENSITVSDFTISNTGKTALMVNINLDEKASVKGMSFNITLPAGLEFVTESNKPKYKMGSMLPVTPQVNIDNGILYVSAASSDWIKGSKGMLIAFQIQPTSSFNTAIDGTLQGSIADVTISEKVGQSTQDVKHSGSTFTMTVADYDVILDENSPFAPETTEEAVDILVKRTLTKDKWSTICLPFSIGKSKLESVFGAGFQLAEFDSYSYDDKLETISIKFNDYTGTLKSDGVYLIKTKDDMSQFTFKATVTATSASTNTYTESVYDEELEEDRDIEKGKFIGTYVADTYVPKDDMFISDNKFYYSIGTSKIKGFRGYFWFKDKVKADEARVYFTIDGDDATKIQAAKFTKVANGRVYTVSGQYVGENVDMKKLPKGVYIVDGVKVVND
jgi:hypothetical protein